MEFRRAFLCVFFKQKTAYELRISDWSSDVCSSDLVVWDAMALAFVMSLIASAILIAFPQVMYPDSVVKGLDRFLPCIIFANAWSDVSLAALAYRLKLGRASCRESVCQ